MTIEEAMVIMGVKKSVTKRELLQTYRRLALERHPDHGGTADAFTCLTQAYEALEATAIVESTAKSKTVDGVLLQGLGRGYPITESAMACDVCDGKGYAEYTAPGARIGEEQCKACNGTGLFSYPCKKCGGTGDYKHPKTDRVIGICRLCDGSGRFYPKLVRTSTWSFYLQARVFIPGTNILGQPCRECDGEGKVDIRSNGEPYYVKCSACEGIGEVKMWNPVIPRGLLSGMR